MTARSRRWLWMYSGLLALATSLPLLLASQVSGDAWRFSGFLIAVGDGNTYIAKMLLGSTGDWLFRTPYTLIPQRGVLLYLPYILLGKLAAGRSLHDQLVGLYHLLRVMSIPLFVFATYRFVARYLPRESDRRLATFLATAGAGLGWLLLAFGGSPGWDSIPLSFISPETFGFLATMTAPHLILARACLLFGLTAYLETQERQRASWAGQLWLLATFLVSPLTGATLIVVIGAEQLYRLGIASRSGAWAVWWHGARLTIRMALLSVPYVAYLAVIYLQDPFLHGWATQNRLPSPHLGYYAFAYGWLLVPAAFGVREMWTSRLKADLFPLIWLLLFPVLAYAPVGVQRRLIDGLWVALVTLTVLGLSTLGERSRRKWQAAVVVLALPSTMILLVGSTRLASQPAEPAFLPADQVAVFEAMAESAQPGQVAFTDFSTANALPAWVPLRVPIGHGPESVDLAAMEQVVATFFGAPSTAERLAIAREYDVDWVVVSPAVRAMGVGASWGPAWAEKLERGAYTLYRWLGSE
ncbi:MAG: hypothetical protein WBR18_13995 [Anaerolineales bacterium]